MSNDTLDKSNLDQLIDALLVARSYGFESSHSPVEFLLQAMIDLCLQIGDDLQEGTPGRKLNQELIFLDDAKADALGNSPQKKIGPIRSPPFSDISAGKFLKTNLASFLVLLKNRVPFQKAFLELLKGIPDLPRSPPSGGAEKSKNLVALAGKVAKTILPDHLDPIADLAMATAEKVIDLQSKKSAAAKQKAAYFYRRRQKR